jgi:hypothetical protein
MLTKTRLPLFVALIFCLELLIYFWSYWTSTFDEGNYFAMHAEFIFDKSARLAGRVSSLLILLILCMVGYFGLKNIYANSEKRTSFLVLTTLFSFNHIIHLLFVLLRFQSHGESISFSEQISIGGTIHGVITFACIIIIPFILWKNQVLNKYIYSMTILHLLNLSSFIVKTFLSKINLPDHPAYHNQFGAALITAACLYILFRVFMENRPTIVVNKY